MNTTSFFFEKKLSVPNSLDPDQARVQTFSEDYQQKTLNRKRDGVPRLLTHKVLAKDVSGNVRSSVAYICKQLLTDVNIEANSVDCGPRSDCSYSLQCLTKMRRKHFSRRRKQTTSVVPGAKG